MQIKDVPTKQLRQMLQDTERVAGETSSSAELLRRELDRREFAAELRSRQESPA